MFLLYGVVQILQAVAPDFRNIMCHVSKNHFMNNFGLSKCSEIRTCLTKDCQEKRKSCEVQRSGLKHNARCGLVAGMKVIGPVFLPREPYTVHYTVKRKVCAGLKPI